MLKSPIKGVSDAGWSEYFSRSVKPGPIPAGLIGAFRFKLRALEDIGIVENVSKNNGKWSATWKACTKEQFLSSTALQYDAFKKQSVMHYEWLLTRYYPSLGADIEGRKATASGLLSVMRLLGIGCFEKWLGGNRLPNANAVFKEMNSIF